MLSPPTEEASLCEKLLSKNGYLGAKDEPIHFKSRRSSSERDRNLLGLGYLKSRVEPETGSESEVRGDRDVVRDQNNPQNFFLFCKRNLTRSAQLFFSNPTRYTPALKFLLSSLDVRNHSPQSLSNGAQATGR